MFYINCIIDDIDNYVIDAKDNIIKADELIREEIKTKTMWTNTMKCILIMIFLILLGIIIALIFILKG